MRAARIFLATASVGLLGLGACAPVQSKTHFQRWDEYAAKMATEEGQEDAAEVSGTSGSPPPAPTPAPAVVPAPAPAAAPASDPYGASSTPPITGTSTGSSRVIRPGAPDPQDDDVIY